MKQMLKSALISEKLCDLFFEEYKMQIENLKKCILTNNKLDSTEIFLCFASLYCLSYIRATKTDIKISEPAIFKISHQLCSFLVVKYILLTKSDIDPDVLLNKLADRGENLIKIWDESINKQPAPHWYIGKEISCFLRGRDAIPDILLITYAGEYLSNHSILIKKFLDNVAEKFNIIE